MFAMLNPFLGKITRLHWWLCQIAIFVLAIGGLIATIFLFADPDSEAHTRNGYENLGIAVTVLLVIYANFSTCLNRLRDSGRSRFWYLTFLLPTVGSALMLYFCGIEKGPNQRDNSGSGSSVYKPIPVPSPQRSLHGGLQHAQKRTFGRRVG